jgi:hypothetical protein
VGWGLATSLNSLDVYIGYLRRKLDEGERCLPHGARCWVRRARTPCITLQRRLALASAGAVLVTSLAATAVVFVTVRGMRQTKQVDKQLVLRLQDADLRMLQREIDQSARADSFLVQEAPRYLYDAFISAATTRLLRV